MKTMTCAQLGGPCDQALHGTTADEVIKAQDRHLQDDGRGRRRRPRAGAQGDEGPLEAADRRHGLVPEHEARRSPALPED